MANIGYIRVSTKEQNTGRQFEGFTNEGITLDKIFVEKISGKDTNRPQLKAMLDYIREGDVIYVESYSRFARSGADLVELVERLKTIGVGFVSLKEKIDTTNPEGNLMFFVFCGIAQFERECIKRRQREGIDLALKEGRAYGRPQAKLSSTWEDNYKLWKQGDIRAIDFMARENLPKATFYKLVKRYEDNNK